MVCSFRFLLFLFLLVFSAFDGLSADPVRGEFWVRQDLMDIQSPGTNYRETGQYSDREEGAMITLLEDAQWAFSGMIYGFSFVWTPSALARNVEEELTIEPLGLIPWGDPRMTTSAVVEENGFVYVALEYQPDASQQARLEGWSSQSFVPASGAGEAHAGSTGRREAIEQAIKETVRAWLRAREYNRPREVSGRVALTEFPQTGLRGINIRASVSLRMDLEPLRHYAVD